MTKELTVTNVREIEAQSIGTTAYHRVSPFYKMVVSDGVIAIAELGACWLLDEIGLKISKHKDLDEYFTVVELKVKDEKGKLIAYKEVDEENITFFEENIPCTDFPCDIKFFLINGILILPNEY